MPETNQGTNSNNKDSSHDVLFYLEEVLVEKSSADSAQSIVYFGHETILGIRVVIKQYMRSCFRNMLREIKIFSLLEHFKMKQNNRSSLF